ncbi:MAG TPA: CRTAC1 family protein [Bryobacteraceae bacterium]|nr:CRTAC1 family protein [Bryobacteraceae bacterium]
MLRWWPFLFLAAGSLFAQGMGGSVKAVPRGSDKTKIARPSPQFQVIDSAASSGLDFTDVHGGVKAKKHILEMTGHGVAIFDYNNDGRRDVFFVNGTRFGASTPAPHKLFENLGGGRFRDVTAASGIVNHGWGQGVCAGDYDNDGNVDLAITYYGYNVLYRNRSGGSFEDVTARAGLPVTGSRWATSCAFLDYDRDGLLDLFVSNYVVFDAATANAPGSSPFCFWRGLAVFCGPKGFPGGTNILYHNEGGRFTDVSKAAGILREGLHYGLGVVTADWNNDGWTDIYVACDSTQSLLYRNNRDGTFTDVAVEAGAAYGDAGQEQGSMGVAAGDYDNDGFLDIVRTNFMDETSTLYKNLGEWFFEDATQPAGLALHTKVVGWGVEFFDLDHDGWKDIFMANGHIYPELEGKSAGEDFRQPKILYWNLRNGAFRDVAGTAQALGRTFSSRGVATADLDGDGTVEVLVSNLNEKPSLLQFQLKRGNALILELVGTKSNRSAIGARVSLQVGPLAMTNEVRSGSSFASQSDFRLHFGLGDAATIDKVEIRWPNGGTEVVKGLGANRWITIREGAGVVSQRSFRGETIPAPDSKR